MQTWLFQSTKVQEFFRRLNIKPFSIGPYTPWPNRAEAAVRVFLETLHDLCSQVGLSLELKQVTVRELLRKTASVRNSMVTYGGQPLSNLFSDENHVMLFRLKIHLQSSCLCQFSSLEHMDQTLQNMAMKSYLEARQRADLRRDIVARLIPTEGPYSPGDRVYYWQVDKSKIKHGVTSGRWYKARVLSQDGALCVIDTETTVLRVNQSKTAEGEECME